MDGKTCLVTGGTQGIGRVTAVELAKRGARVLLVARDPVKAEATVAEMRAQRADAAVDVLLADLSSQAAIRQLADDVKRKYPRLDVLVNNAGGIFIERRTTVDGIEWTFAVNHLAYFLLTNLLVDLLKASGPARVVSVSSGAHMYGRMHWDNLQLVDAYRPMRAYTQSKLCNILFTRELARRLAGSTVTANCLHPGAVHTNFGRSEGGLFRLGVQLATPFMISPTKGAQTMIYLATSPEVAGISGKYFYKCKEARGSSASRDEAAPARLWAISAAMTGLDKV